MLIRNGPVVKSVESVLRLEGSIWWERFVKEVYDKRTDRRTDRHTTTANTALASAVRVKSRSDLPGSVEFYERTSNSFVQH